MLRISLAAGLALFAAACGGPNADYEKQAGRAEGFAATAGAPPPPPPAPAMAADEAAAPREANRVAIIQDQPGGGQPGQPVPPGTMMAYTYEWGFQVPATNMENLLNAHKKLCEDAGPAKCYVVNSAISGLGQESSSGSLNLRASEDWVRTFEKGVEEGLKPFDAKLDTTSRSGEDLTKDIVDGTARLNSQKTMRDRLEGLLKDRPGKLSDLLEIERELARVQGDIDARESVLAVLKQRVAMSTLTFDYRPKYSAGSGSVWKPLGDAFSGFGRNFINAMAAIVDFISQVLPLVIFVAIAVWLLFVLFGWFGRRRRKKAEAAKAAA